MVKQLIILISVNGTAGTATSYDGALPSGELLLKGDWSQKGINLYRADRPVI